MFLLAVIAILALWAKQRYDNYVKVRNIVSYLTPLSILHLFQGQDQFYFPWFINLQKHCQLHVQVFFIAIV